MNRDVQYSDIPLVWPPRAPELGNWETPDAAPWTAELFIVNCLFGITYDLDGRGISWLESLLGRPDFRCRLVLLLYPACATREEHLNYMLRWQKSYGDRFEVRLLPVVNARPITVLSLSSGDEWAKLTMAIGAVPNLGIKATSPGVINFLFHPSRVLHETWRRWFDQLWDVSVPLTHRSAAIPALVPAKGSPEASRIWLDYEQMCYTLVSSATTDLSSEAGQVTLFRDTASTQPDQARPSVTEELGVPQLDPLAEKIATLYQKGCLVSVDKYSRIPPLEVPIKPAWFGVETLRRVGSVSRQLSYRVSVFKEEELRSIENKKKAARDLLQRFSFSLADGQWWMPHNARPLFEKELDRVNCEGVKQLQTIVGKDIEKFIESRKNQILKDAEDMYQEFHPGKPLPRHTAEQILTALNERLSKLNNERLLPLVTYTEVQFLPENGSKWTTPWSQALRLLSDIAEFPRRALTDRFFFRGLSVDKEELIKAMDVCGDALVKRLTDGRHHVWDVENQARRELGLIKRIVDDEDANPRAKCGALLALIEGGGDEHCFRVMEELNGDEHH